MGALVGEGCGSVDSRRYRLRIPISVLWSFPVSVRGYVCITMGVVVKGHCVCAFCLGGGVVWTAREDWTVNVRARGCGTGNGIECQDWDETEGTEEEVGVLDSGWVGCGRASGFRTRTLEPIVSHVYTQHVRYERLCVTCPYEETAG